MIKSRSKKKQQTEQQKQQPEPEILSPKERQAQKRKAQEVRRKIYSVTSISLVLGIAIGVPVALFVDPISGLGVALSIPLLFVCFNYPRLGLWLFLIYLPFNGTVTYWVGEGNPFFQVAKDFLYLPALLGLILECRQQGKPILVPKQLLPTLCILLVFCLLTLFVANGSRQLLPNCESLVERVIIRPDGSVFFPPCSKGGYPFLQGLLGLKVLVGYVPLIFCAYHLIEDKKKLLQLGRVLVVLAIIACSLALVQYWLLKTGQCKGTRDLSGVDLYQANLQAKCLVGGSLLYSPQYGVIRLPGTFVSPWHWSWFLVANGTICFASAFSETSRLWRIIGLIGIGLVEINAIICGQRLAFGLVPALLIVMLILTGQIANLKRFIPISIVLAVILSVGLSFFGQDFIQERADSFVSRMNQTPPLDFIKEQINFATRNQGGILGRGLGVATSSARIFGPVSFVESFHAKLLFEMGYLGFLAYMVFLTHLLYLSFKAYRSLRDPSLRSFASSFWVFMLIISYLPYWYALDTDPVCVYYWFFAGVIFKLPVIDKQEQEKLKATQTEGKSYKLKRKKISFA